MMLPLSTFRMLASAFLVPEWPITGVKPLCLIGIKLLSDEVASLIPQRDMLNTLKLRSHEFESRS
jgi:hypothetical protein